MNENYLSKILTEIGAILSSIFSSSTSTFVPSFNSEKGTVSSFFLSVVPPIKFKRTKESSFSFR
jgi:hypothetical protein